MNNKYSGSNSFEVVSVFVAYILQLTMVTGSGWKSSCIIGFIQGFLGVRASWRFALFVGNGYMGGGHSVEDHYLHKNWIIFFLGGRVANSFLGGRPPSKQSSRKP